MCKRNKTLSRKDREDFIWYTALGISKRDAFKKPDDETLKKCIERAYLDLNRTLRFIYSDSDLKKMKAEDRQAFEKQKKNWRDACIGVISTEISNILKDKSSQFDSNHESICTALHARANQSDSPLRVDPKFEFTFGHAQKWANMTLKYMLIINIDSWKMDRLVPYLHVPIDKYILKSAYEDFSEEFKELIKKGGKAENPDWFVCDKNQGDKRLKWTWSQIPTYKCYKDFQIEMRKVLDGIKYPIIWENSAWLKAAAGNGGSETSVT